jgi:hypothetical protein
MASAPFLAKVISVGQLSGRARDICFLAILESSHISTFVVIYSLYPFTYLYIRVKAEKGEMAS